MIADGAVGTVCLFPNVLGLVLYTGGLFCLVDYLTSLLQTLLTTRVAGAVLSELDEPVDKRGHRVRLYLPIALEWLLKIWIGLPMIHVLNLFVSQHSQDQEALHGLITGFSWEAKALRRLPLPSWPTPSSLPMPWFVIQTSLILGLLAYVYWYWATGYELVRRGREISDALLAKVTQRGRDSLSPRQILVALQDVGWSPTNLKAAAFFLFSMKVRVMWVQPVYQRWNAREYGLLRVLLDAGVASLLFTLHPVASGLYVASKVKAGKKVLSTRKIFRKHLANLPDGST